MKKNLIIKLLCTLAIIIPCNLYSTDITVGATAWYVWGDRYEDVTKNSDRPNKSYAFDSTFLYGPAISVKFSDDFNLTFVYLYGKFDYDDEIYKDAGGAYNIKTSAIRSDSDLALNYRLNGNFKAFAGIKYMAYEVKSSFNDFLKDYCENHSKHTSIGPGLGLSGTLPIIENIFLLATVSGFYLYSNGEEFKDDGIYGRKYTEPVSLKIGYNEYGINSTMSIAYYIAPASTVISLGGRFQYFIIDYDKHEFFPINSITNRIYGITLTATYTFSF